MADALFENPRLVPLYDALQSDREDLRHYAAMVDEFEARSVLDLGCGTGTFVGLLAMRGLDVTGADPAKASLDVARQKPGAGRASWILGDATDLPAELAVDLCFMTANVAQVFVSDPAWSETLRCIRSALAPGGRLVFETRDPSRRAWERWNREQSFSRIDAPGIGAVEAWVEVLDVALPLVSFRWAYHFLDDDELITSDSTLRFRERDEIEESLAAAGFVVGEVRDAPDRPDEEFVFVVSPISL